MSILPQFEKLANRFLDGGWSAMGWVKREPRNNSASELLNSIKAYAKSDPDVADFLNHLNQLDPKHLGLAQDIIDLSRVKPLLASEQKLSLKQKLPDGQTILHFFLNRLTDVSKKNPEAINLVNKVINNSDTQNAKYFLIRFFGHQVENLTPLSEQIKAVKDIVPTIAKDTIDSPYTGDFKHNEEFFSYIKELISSDAKPENIRLLGKIHDIIENFSNKVQHTCDIWSTKKADTAKLKENLEILPDVLKNADNQGKTIAVDKFLQNNINLD